MRKFIAVVGGAALIGSLLCTGAFAAPSNSGTPMAMKMAAKSTLYDRLGGKKAIEAVVSAFVMRVAKDTRINKFFAATASNPKRLAKFEGNLVDQICMASGGPCKYMGKDMKTAHAGMGITTADFNALVGDLAMTLDQFKVAAADKDALLGALAPMKSQIVEKP